MSRLLSAARGVNCPVAFPSARLQDTPGGGTVADPNRSYHFSAIPLSGSVANVCFTSAPGSHSLPMGGRQRRPFPRLNEAAGGAHLTMVASRLAPAFLTTRRGEVREKLVSTRRATLGAAFLE